MNDCSCIYCDVDEGYDVTRKLAAVQTCMCSECKRIIRTGEHYFHTVYWEYSYCDDCDDFVSECECIEPDCTYFTCLDCRSIIDVFFCNGYYFKEVLDRLRWHIEDTGDNVLACDMTKLTKRARDGVCDLVEIMWERDEDGLQRKSTEEPNSKN